MLYSEVVYQKISGKWDVTIWKHGDNRAFGFHWTNGADGSSLVIDLLTHGVEVVKLPEEG